MNPAGDYTVHFADPDMCVSGLHQVNLRYLLRGSFFQWQDILQIIIPPSALASLSSKGDMAGGDEGNTSCPICLSPPTAPRMTKCGHVSSTYYPFRVPHDKSCYRCSVSLVFSTTLAFPRTNGRGVPFASIPSTRSTSRLSNGTLFPRINGGFHLTSHLPRPRHHLLMISPKSLPKKAQPFT